MECALRLNLRIVCSPMDITSDIRRHHMGEYGALLGCVHHQLSWGLYTNWVSLDYRVSVMDELDMEQTSQVLAALAGAHTAEAKDAVLAPYNSSSARLAPDGKPIFLDFVECGKPRKGEDKAEAKERERARPKLSRM